MKQRKVRLVRWAFIRCNAKCSFRYNALISAFEKGSSEKMQKINNIVRLGHFRTHENSHLWGTRRLWGRPPRKWIRISQEISWSICVIWWYLKFVCAAVCAVCPLMWEGTRAQAEPFMKNTKAMRRNNFFCGGRSTCLLFSQIRTFIKCCSNNFRNFS